MSRKPTETQLGAFWSKKQRDVMLAWPTGPGSKSDAHWLRSIFTVEFEQELRKRGYDPTTLRFTVEIDFTSKHAQEKFPTLFRESQSNTKAKP